MYKDFFRMKSDAFSNQPLPGLFFTSRSHRDVWSCLVSEINRNEPYLLVTGEYGTGKTTLCLRLVRALKKNGKLPFLYVATPNYDYATILQRIATSLGLAVDQQGVSMMQDRIFQYFEKEQPQKGILLIFDDVQDMGMATLANLRLLANFSCDGFFPFRLMLFGHPSFIQRLHSQVLQALNQRIRRRFHLEPLSPLETKEYIYFRLFRSGASGTPIFAEDALVTLHDYSHGVPRLINNVCDACLVLAASQGVEVIDGGIVAEAIRYLQGGTPELSGKAPGNLGAATCQAGGTRSAGQQSKSMNPARQPLKGGHPTRRPLNQPRHIGLLAGSPQERKGSVRGGRRIWDFRGYRSATLPKASANVRILCGWWCSWRFFWSACC